MSSFLTSQQLRESFLKFFEERGHRRDRSSPLIPHNDPTLLFANAGMNQYKDLFTGQEKRSYTRATTAQKCVRAGGKHNDLEQVGFTRRHQTFFEMLGNFSFGDYFKKEAIEFAWEYLTKVVGFDSKVMWISVFEKDDEAAELWKKISGLPADRIVRMGEKDNFWAMGDTGPCGPCSEIYLDRGEKFGKNETIFDGGERFLEVWNLVFMQYERFADGVMKPLPKPSVDTGMGLERLASLAQNVESNYLTDGMQVIMQGFAELLKKPYGKNAEDDLALRVLTDHIRAVSFLIADGVQPSNEGRGYVLRRILRRAIRYGKKLGCTGPFFHQGVSFVEKEMGSVYPELMQNSESVKKFILFEEEKFFETLETGLRLLEAKTKDLKKGSRLPGAVAFQLYDTFGFPLDLTEVILKEQGLGLDQEGFDRELEQQRERSRGSWKGSGEAAVADLYKALAQEGVQSEFTGYHHLKEEAKVVVLLNGGQRVKTAGPGSKVEIVLDRCPFYAESGGQVGDQGELAAGSKVLVKILDTQKPTGSFHVLQGEVIRGELTEGAKVEARVDESLRLKTRINHTITHVLHATLQEVLGGHIKQAGSLVRPDYLRFDFNHFQALQREELDKIERIVNQRILKNSSVKLAEESLETAVAGGAKAFFGEKYGDRVRVISVGDFSKELCGGTHAESLGEAGLFKITAESSVASGVRRIVAVTGEKAYDTIREKEERLEKVADLLKTSEKEVVPRVEKLLKERADLQKKLADRSSSSAADVAVQNIEGTSAIIQIAALDDIKDLRPLSDRYKQKVKSGVVVVGAAFEGRATVVVSVSDDLAPQFGMDRLVKRLCESLSGKGGGKPNFAQVGGSNVAALTEQTLAGLVQEHLQSVRLIA